MTLRAGTPHPMQAAPEIFAELHRPHLVANPVVVCPKSRLMRYENQR